MGLVRPEQGEFDRTPIGPPGLHMNRAGGGAGQRLLRQQGLKIKVATQFAESASPLGRNAGDHPPQARRRGLH